MPLEFQPRGGGYRVVRMVHGVEHVLASMETQAFIADPSGNRWDELPAEQCRIRSAIGDLSVPDLEEMLAFIHSDK